MAKYKKEQKTDSYGRPMTQKCKYYSGAQFGLTKNTHTWTETTKDGKVNASYKDDKKYWVNGWNISKTRGLIKFSGFENSRSRRYKSKENGKRHVMLFVEVFYERTGNIVVEYIDFCIDSKTAVFKKTNMFMDCNTKGGGSWTKKVK